MVLLFQINFSLDTKMCKNHLTLHELRIGDWVQEYSDITEKFSMPMYVSAIFEDGTVYLNFNGNEGDIWEANIDDIAPIKIETDILKGFGFEYVPEVCDFNLQVDNSSIYVHRFQYGPNKWVIQFGNDVGYTPTCANIHELQHAYYEYVGKPLALSWKGI